MNISFDIIFQPWSGWTQICPAFANSVDPDQLASAEPGETLPLQTV